LGTDREGWTRGRALVALEERLEAVRAGTWKRPQDLRVGDDDPTFRLFASSWLEDNMLEWRPSTIADIKWRLESHLLPHVGEERLSTFDIPRVTAVKTTLLKESRRISERLEAGVVERDAHNMPLRPLSNESINKCMALLSRILDDAVERGYLCDNPSRRVRRLRHHRPRRPVLEPHEVRAMFEAADRLTDAPAASQTRCCKSPNFALRQCRTRRSPGACRSRSRRRTTASRASSRPAIRFRSFASGCACCALPACASTRPAEPAAATST
jgi:integrase